MTDKPRLIQIISLLWLLLMFGASAFLLKPTIDSWSSAFYSYISKSRQCSDKIVLVTLDDRDIRSLGGWPVSRDYYAYMIHVLTDRDAQTIGLDFLFSETDSLFKEYDDALSGFIESSGRVVLPAIIQSDGEALLPAKPFRKRTAIGFSNLGDESPVRSVPLAMQVKDSLWASFGLALAKHYLNAASSIVPHFHSIEFTDSDGKSLTIPIDSHFMFHPNYFGGLERVRKVGFVDLLRAFESNPDSLDFTGKLVLVAPVAQTLPVIKQIPKEGSVPGSLIHLTVAENIITGKFIRSFPSGIILWILLFFTGILFWMVFNQKKRETILLLALLGSIWFIAGLILYPLKWIQLSLSPVFYSISVLAGLSVLWGAAKYSRQKTHNLLLEQEIDQTRIELDRVRTEKQLSEEEKKEAVITLEKHLRDLKAIQLPQASSAGIFKEIIHAPDSPVRTVLDQVLTVASDNIPVLILGETGTGKELIARAIHQNSPRSKREFMAVNCGALSENLLESELFGHERGSFTGAHTRRIGRFEQANGGTLFLDEISETSAAFQARLLRVLQEGVFERVGGQQPIKTDVRIVAATNRNLKQEIDAGNFRADLFFRLNGFPIQLPPLRERKIDIPLLVGFFIQRHSKESLSISQAALERMQQYGWPGNVRELENCVRRAAILATSRGHQSISAEDLPEELREVKQSESPSVSYLPLEEQILSSLRSYQFSRSAISETARALGNRDRGTITEYFRGLCFQALVEKNYSVNDAIIQISGSSDQKINSLVLKKFDSYLNNIVSVSTADIDSGTLPSTFQGLPKQFHSFLVDLIQNRDRIH